MPTIYVSYNPSTRVARVAEVNTDIPDGFTAIGSFVHPDATYPDSYVIWHGVREILYHRSAKDVTQTAMFPNNITDMDKIKIDSQLPKPVVAVPVEPE